jgi:hypothetical protein
LPSFVPGILSAQRKRNGPRAVPIPRELVTTQLIRGRHLIWLTPPLSVANQPVGEALHRRQRALATYTVDNDDGLAAAPVIQRLVNDEIGRREKGGPRIAQYGDIPAVEAMVRDRQFTFAGHGMKRYGRPPPRQRSSRTFPDKYLLSLLSCCRRAGWSPLCGYLDAGRRQARGGYRADW